ncbi:MAG: hypothetical protein U0414_06085 [Polyangiaceae bacterium]
MERVRKVEVAAGYRDRPPRVTAESFYGPILATLPVPKVTTAAGRSLRFAMEPERGLGVVIIIGGLLFALVFAPIFVMGRAMFSRVFGGVGAVIALAALIKGIFVYLGETKIPSVEISAEPVFLGESFDVKIDQRGPVAVRRIRVDLLCSERAEYVRGTTTHLATETVREISVLEAGPRVVARGEVWSVDGRADLPHEPSSFEAHNNSVRWFLRVRAEIDRFPDYEALYEFRALPRVPS